MSKIKQQLYLLCGEYIKAREKEIRTNIAEAQEAANDDTKSSAGDKFETGRESMQQQIDLNITRLNELDKLKQTLDLITAADTITVAVPGSLVQTNLGSYYIAIGAGKIEVDGAFFYAISAASPIGTRLLGQKKGYKFDFNGKNYVIERIF